MRKGIALTLLTIANLIAAWLTRGPRRLWHLAEVSIIIIERSGTFPYVRPTMVRRMGTESVSEGDVKTALARWPSMNHGHHALTLVGWVAALTVFSVSNKRAG